MFTIYRNAVMKNWMLQFSLGFKEKSVGPGHIKAHWVASHVITLQKDHVHSASGEALSAPTDNRD